MGSASPSRPSTQAVLELAEEHGFDLAGVAPLHPPPAALRFEQWLAAGHQADMRWLEEQRERILDPRLSLAGGKSLLVLGLGHSRPATTLSDGARVARYAAGRDYHNVLGRKLRRLAGALRARGWLGEWKKVVDAGPLLERSHAAEAGLGFESKAANLLSRRFGPWFFLGELLLDVELAPTPGPAPGSCGTCTACLEACPSAAIVAQGVVDARRCLSYHTIENKGSVPHALRPALGAWVFGCDVCSEVCPYGGAAPDLATRFGTHAALREGTLARWLALAPAALAAEVAGSPLTRAGSHGLARNAALVLGNHPSEVGRSALVQALEHPAGLVREAAFWALSTAHASDAGIGARLARARDVETDAAARGGMERTLALSSGHDAPS